MSGRNLDYGHQKSDSREGSMVKKSLLTMAKDLYDLYRVLHDEDDLPQWCHYKIAKSQNELEAVANYLTSKIAKSCVDQGINNEDLHTIVSESILRGVIREGLLDSMRNMFSKKDRTQHISSSILRNPKDISYILQGESYKDLKVFFDALYNMKSLNDSLSIFNKKSFKAASRKDKILLANKVIPHLRDLEIIQDSLLVYLEDLETKLKTRFNESMDNKYSTTSMTGNVAELVNKLVQSSRLLNDIDIESMSNQVRMLCNNDKNQIASFLRLCRNMMNAEEINFLITSPEVQSLSARINRRSNDNRYYDEDKTLDMTID